MQESEIRKHYFRDEYVIIAPKRQQRPMRSREAKVEDASRCYFCPENLDVSQKSTYVDNNPNGDWEIVSILNKYPAVTLGNPRAYGQAEVIVETRRHGLEINEFSVEHIARVFDAYANRYKALREIEGVKYVIVFKNEGGKAGASIAHSHSQIIALPLVPPKVRAESLAYEKYRIDNKSCPYCDIIKKESGSERAVFEDDNIFVLCPYASDAPYGVWIIPKRHIKSILELEHKEKISIAKAFKIVLGKLDSLGIAYNYFIENCINEEDYHMHIKIEPRPNVWAGLELGTGVIINGVAPEAAADIYKNQ